MKSQKKANFRASIGILCALALVAAIFSGLSLKPAAEAPSTSGGFVDAFDSDLNTNDWTKGTSITAAEKATAYIPATWNGTKYNEDVLNVTGTNGMDNFTKNALVRKTDSPAGEQLLELVFSGDYDPTGADGSRKESNIIKGWGTGIVARAVTDSNGNITDGYIVAAKMNEGNAYYDKAAWIRVYKITNGTRKLVKENYTHKITEFGNVNQTICKLQATISDDESTGAVTINYNLAKYDVAKQTWTAGISGNVTDSSAPISSGKSGITLLSESANAPVVDLYNFSEKFSLKYDITFKFVKNGTTIDTKTVSCNQGELPTVPAIPSVNADAEYHYTSGAWNEDITEATGEKTYTYTYTSTAHTGNETCTAAGTCSVCGYAIPAHGHKFTNYVSDNNATYEADGTKTASCDYNCGATDTVQDEGSKLQKSDPQPIKIVMGANGKFVNESKEGLTFKAEESIDKFVEVSIDGATVNSDNYTVVSGSTVVTLKPEYLETLSLGNHSIEIKFTTGIAATEFSVAAKSETGTGSGTESGSNSNANTNTETNTGSGTADKNEEITSPKTGENSNVELMVMLMLTASAVIIAALVCRKIKRSKINVND